jgi:hypothetical protein
MTAVNRSYLLQVARPGDAARPDFEALVRDAFAAQHGADLRHFMPSLLGVRRRSGTVCGVVGLRGADEEPLFLERYLGQPVEQAIAASCGATVQRRDIVEVGNLAGGHCRGTMKLLAELPHFLLDSGRQWIVFTATDTLRTLLRRFGAPLVELAPAREEAVAGLGDSWGRYYQRDPRVVAGYLPDGVRLRERFARGPELAA